MLTAVVKEQRYVLPTQQLLKLQQRCEEGLAEPHFAFLSYDNLNSLESLKNLYSVRMKIEQLRTSLMEGDMQGVFSVPSSMVEDPTGGFDYVPGLGCAPVDLPIVFDSGATVSVSPSRGDFETLTAVTAHLQNISGHSPVIGEGIVRWTINDDDGHAHTIRTRAYFVPNARVRLFSVQAFLGQNGGSFHIEGAKGFFHFNARQKLTFNTFGRDETSRLPIAYLTKAHDARKERVYNVLGPDNSNLTAAQKELLGWHFKLGHFHLQWIQRLTSTSRKGEQYIKVKGNGVSTCPLPHCAACRYAKAAVLPTPKGTLRAPPTEGNLKKDRLVPGSMISTDQFVSSVKGRLHHTRGRERPEDAYSGGTVYVDDSSGFLFVRNQVSLRASETLRGKHKFKRYAATCGVNVTSYRGDNGVFRSREYVADLRRQKQSIRYSGVGAHHQNGVAERSIRTVSESARTMLIHAAMHWPKETNVNLWPFAVKYAAYIYNRLPKANGEASPLEIFSGSHQDSKWVKRARVFGCPCYVLDPTVQDGKKLPRWKPKSRRGQFLGKSDRHASDIGLIRNLRTGFVSSQYHVVYDDVFCVVTISRRLRRLLYDDIE